MEKTHAGAPGPDRHPDPGQQLDRGPDRELVEAATRVARTRCRGERHTVAAAARARDGRIVTALNVYHFTGGPCAELILIGAAAAEGAYELDTVVTVADRDRGIVPPCGRCRQILLDYFPALEVIVGAEGDRVRTVRIADLLPESYVWADQQAETGTGTGAGAG
ncbi:cytidine deaminase [Streptomyces ziwulingensis]|uniref:Cytidine deaminase n=1 Tax=Streptomyces ziwulingensis TaxID=1045501 RepID=A0ABP9CC83_9ACTN